MAYGDDPRRQRRERSDTTRTQPLIDLDAGSTESAPDSATGSATGLIDLDQPETPQTPVPDTPTHGPRAVYSGGRLIEENGKPTRGRGIVDRIGDAIGGFFAEAGKYGPGQEQSGGTTAARYEEPEETRTLVRPTDRRTAQERDAEARRRVVAGIGAPSDVTRVTPAGSPQAKAEQQAVTTGLRQQETNKRNFTPKNLRDLAKRGMQHAAELNQKAAELAPTDAIAAEALHQAAEDASRKAYNAQVVADDAEQFDTFGEIARSNLIGIIHDPAAGAKKNLAEYGGDERLSFTPEEQTRDLGKNLPVGRERGFDASKDIAAPLVGSLPLYVAGGMAGKAATRAIAGGLEAINAPRAATIARALAQEIETTGIYGPKQAGLAGLREAGSNLAENLPALARRGALEGQGVGMVQAAREAQQQGANPVTAAGAAFLANIPFGIAAEVGLGGLTRVLGVADRSVSGALDRVIEKTDRWRGIDRAYKTRLEAIGETQPLDRRAQSALDVGAEAAGQTPVSDKTLEGQRVDLATALEGVLAAKEAAPNFGSDVGLIERDRGYLEPRVESGAEPDVPLRSQMDVARERAGYAPEDVRQTVDATTRMRRAAAEQAAIERQMAEEAEQLRVEQAAQARAREKQGPLTLAQTIARAGRDREAGEPMAAEYHDAINKMADAQARMQDATKEGGEPSAKLKLDYARARAVLNEVRRKYGKQIGAAALIGLASHDGDLSDDEKKWLGIGGALALSTGVVKVIPRDLAERAFKAIDLAEGNRASAQSWLDHIAVNDAPFGEHYPALRQGMEALKREFGDKIPSSEVRSMIERLTTEPGPVEQKPEPARFYSRMVRAIERLDKQLDPASGEWKGGKKWDEPRPAGDWIGKLKGLSTFSKTEFALLEPALKAAQDAKQKLSRADVLAMADQAAPTIEEVALGQERTGSDVDKRTVADLEDLRDQPVETLQQQRTLRQNEIAELEREIENRTEDARNSMEYRETEANDMLNSAKAEFDEIAKETRGDALWQEVTDEIIQNVGPDDVPPSVMRNVRQLIDEEIRVQDEPTEPYEVFSSAEPEATEDGTGEEWVLRDYDGNEFRAPTKWEAAAKAEEAGAYDSGSKYGLLPKGYTISQKEKPPKAVWQITSQRRHVNGDPIGAPRVDIWEPDPWRTKEQNERLAKSYFGQDAEIGDVTPTEPDKVWVLEAPTDEHGNSPKGHAGRFESRPNESREEFVNRYVDNYFEPRVGSGAYNRLIDNLESYAYRYASYLDAESVHAGMTDDPESYFDYQHRNIAQYTDEIEALNTMIEEKSAAPKPVVEPEPTDPYLTPIAPTYEGEPKWKGTQSIGGAEDHYELLNVYENAPGGGYRRGHWGSDPANVYGHLRVEVHELPDTPGLTGREVEYFPHEPESARLLRSQIDEARQKIAKEDAKATEIVREYETIPADQRDENTTPSARAMELARNYRDIQNNITNLAKRETELTRRLNVEIGHTPKGRKAHIAMESQADPSSDAGKYGIKRTITQEERDAFAELIAPLEEERARAREEVYAADNRRRDIRRDSWPNLKKDIGYKKAGGSREDGLYGLSEEQEKAYYDTIDAIGDYNTYHDYVEYEGIDSPIATEYLAKLKAIDPRIADLAVEYHESFARQRAANARTDALRDQIDALSQEHGMNQSDNSPVPNIFLDKKLAQGMNAARFLMEMANRGIEDVGWSTGANRFVKASLPMLAATGVYDKVFPGAIRGLLNGLGFKNVPITHQFIRGYGHWMVKLTPEMRTAIRKNGLPIMGVLAMLSLSSEQAEAQSSAEPGARADRQAKDAIMWGSVIGLTAAAGLVAAQKSKAIRSLVHKLPEVRKAMHMDDIAGLPNKTALDLAMPAIDAEPSMAWIALNAAQFHALKGKGQIVGDAATAHYGKVLRDVAEKHELPARAFRARGGEYAIAVPEARAAEIAEAIEGAKPFEHEGVKAGLSSAWAKTYAEAQALLTQQMRDRQAADKVISESQRPSYTYRRPTDIYSNPIGPALKELRRAPGVAGLAVIGTLASQQDDNPMIQRMGLPILGLAAMNAIGARRIGVGIDNLAQGIVNQLRKTRAGTATVRAFNPDRLLSKEVQAAIKTYERAVSKGRAVASQMAKKAKALGPVGDRAVSDVLDREAWEGLAAQTSDVLTVAAELADHYDELTKAQVAAGTLDPEDVIKDYGGPRKYAHYEVAHALAEKPGRAGNVPASPRIAKTQTRTLDIPIREAERALAEARKTGDPAAIQQAIQELDFAQYESYSKRVERGEIREASYRAAAGIEKAHQNIAAAQLFETLRNTPGVAHPEWVQAVSDYQTATGLHRAAKRAKNQADIDATQIMVGDAAAHLDELTRRFKQKGSDYTALPNTPAWGMLRGAIVQRDVAHSLEGFGDPGMYSKALRAWKEMKTVFNPGTNVGNIMSNMASLHVAGLNAWQQPIYYRKALKDIKTYGDGARGLTEAGVMHVNAVNADGSAVTSSSMRSPEGLEELLATTRPETADVIRRESEKNSEYAITEPAIEARRKRRLAKGAAIGAAVGAAKGYDEDNPERSGIGALVGAGLGALAASGKGDLIRRIYGHEDNVARIAFYHRMRDLGLSHEEATQKAIDVLADFRTRSPAIRLLSHTVSPFILYQAKAVPQFAAHVIDHPYRYLSLVALWAGMNELSKREVGEIPEEDRDERDRATWGYFFPGFTQLPITDKEGNRGATDAARYTPFGGFATGAPPGSLPEAFGPNSPSIATPGGPVIDLALRAANVHPYTKQPLFQRDAPLSTNVGTALREATDFALPTAAGYHLRQLTEDWDNRDFEKMKNDLLGPLGTKPRFVRPGQVEDRAEFEYDQRMREIQYLRDRAHDANKNPARDSIIDRKFDELEDLAEQARDRRETAPAKGARP